jgi:hypothetical protein
LSSPGCPSAEQQRETTESREHDILSDIVVAGVPAGGGPVHGFTFPARPDKRRAH